MPGCAASRSQCLRTGPGAGVLTLALHYSRYRYRPASSSPPPRRKRRLVGFVVEISSFEWYCGRCWKTGSEIFGGEEAGRETGVTIGSMVRLGMLCTMAI